MGCKVPQSNGSVHMHTHHDGWPCTLGGVMCVTSDPLLMFVSEHLSTLVCALLPLFLRVFPPCWPAGFVPRLL